MTGASQGARRARRAARAVAVGLDQPEGERHPHDQLELVRVAHRSEDPVEQGLDGRRRRRGRCTGVPESDQGEPHDHRNGQERPHPAGARRMPARPSPKTTAVRTIREGRDELPPRGPARAAGPGEVVEPLGRPPQGLEQAGERGGDRCVLDPVQEGRAVPAEQHQRAHHHRTPPPPTPATRHTSQARAARRGGSRTTAWATPASRRSRPR